MQRTTTVLAILLAIPLAGCVLSGKAKKVQAAPPAPVDTPVAAAPAPPPPLSIPQTRAELPAPQPVPEAALATSQPPEEERRPLVVPPPKSVPKSKPVAAAPKVEAPPAPAPEPVREPVQEVLRPEERTRLLQETTAARREIATIIANAPARVQRQRKDQLVNIRTFQQQSLDFERKGDLRQANELAQRALVLARELR